MTSSAPRSTVERLPALSELADLTQAALRRKPGARFVVAELAVPAVPVEPLLELNSEGQYFAEPNGTEAVGLGALRVFSGAGEARFVDVSASVSQFFGELDDPSGDLRLFGGFAFQPGRASSAAWRPFGEARFVAPRLSYSRSVDRAVLRLVLDRSELVGDRLESLLEDARQLLLALERPTESARSSSAEQLVETARDQDYIGLVELVQQAISEGTLEKLVLARRVEFGLPRPVSPSLALTRLRSIAPECTRFAFSSAGSTFLGATPERLVSKTGQRFQTEAVAGSIQAGQAPPGRLMESSKDRAEQAIVVREVLRALEVVTSSLSHDETPEIHRLRHVAHLRTQIRGELREPLHVLSLVERLHPTPAVGGVPKQRALDWIAAHEPAERGWYAGPVGWVNARGDGFFVVALRSGLLHQSRAALYSGAGIVEGSDAERELAETRWKLQALLGALGALP